MTAAADWEAPSGRPGLRRASTSLHELTEAECWALVRGGDTCRLALVVDGWPRVFPLNYTTLEGTIVFRTGPGSKLTHGPGTRACFEVDYHDDRTSSGWSVMAVGALRDITDARDERSPALRGLPLHPRAPGHKDHWLALDPREVTRRSFQGGWAVPGRYLG